MTISDSSSGTSTIWTCEVPGVCREGHRDLLGDLARAHELFQLAVEVLHAVELAVLHRVEQRLAFAVALLHVVARPHRRLEDLQDRPAAAARLRDQPLRDEVAERARQPRADACLVRRLEGADDAIDGFRGVNGVQRRKDQVAGFGGGQRNLDRLAVAHLADQDHLGRLAQGRAQRGGERRRVAVQLALMHRGLLVGVKELDRVLDGQDVLGACLVDQVDDRRERRRLARSGRAGHQHDAVLQRGHVGEHRRQVQLRQRRNPRGDDAHHDGVRPALLEHVDAEPADVRQVNRRDRTPHAL